MIIVEAALYTTIVFRYIEIELYIEGDFSKEETNLLLCQEFPKGGGGGDVLLYIGLSICPHVASSQWDKSPVRIRLFLYIYTGCIEFAINLPTLLRGFFIKKHSPMPPPHAQFYILSLSFISSVWRCVKKKKKAANTRSICTEEESHASPFWWCLFKYYITGYWLDGCLTCCWGWLDISKHKFCMHHLWFISTDILTWVFFLK